MGGAGLRISEQSRVGMIWTTREWPQVELLAGTLCSSLPSSFTFSDSVAKSVQFFKPQTRWLATFKDIQSNWPGFEAQG